MGAGPKTGPTDPTGRSSGRDHSPFNGWASGDRNITFAVANDLFRKLSEGLAWLRRPCGAREPPALTLVCSKTARAVEWRDFSFTSKTAARLRKRRGRTTLTSKPRGLMPLRLPANLQKKRDMRA